MSNQFSAYKRTEVLTANRETILLMMYAGAIRFLKGAIEAGTRGDIAERARLVTRTQGIVSELRSTLDFKVGGEIAQNLDRLYGFVTNRLMAGSLENDLGKLEEALGVLNTLHEAWEQAVASLRKEKPPAAREPNSK